ncbi:phosphatase PAP2 family protein [Phytoactinopolyspora halotolerans]|uniref:Phosphatase PAP2 family protein n=1 Tax=Phytoactinopolyspora halotolerans TaxID=1981512 RepID=A0A6L9SE05_9ACTN|nr:phosphatase PAP2 family protein [Phytoactinopolyspora halotolerans]NEE03383.1 phosphatase PAP2 family protein [Phytoactinopolyspora halotolerans]
MHIGGIAWQPGDRARTVSREILIVATAVFLYFLVRGFIDGRADLAFDNSDRVIGFERSIGLFVEPDLQARITDHGWLVDVLNGIYMYGHWPVVVGTLIWILAWHRPAFPLFRNALLISGAIGLVIFASFPVAPPRFLADLGFIDTVTEHTNAYRVLQPPGFTNQYAAMPSLHLGWNLLMGIAWATLSTSRWGKVFGIAMPVLMFLAIVLTANHYIVDGIAGGLLALIGLVGASWLVRRKPAVQEPPLIP